MGEISQTRFIALAGVAIILLSLSPTPLHRKMDDQLLKARTAATSGKPDVALEHLEDLLDFYPNHDRYRLSAGEIAYATGEYRRAIHHFESLTVDLENEEELNCLLADLHLQLDETEQAIMYWEAADQNCPVVDETLLTMAQDLIESGSLEDAEDILRILTQSRPLDPDLHLQLGMLIATHNPESALASLRLADDLTENTNLQAQKLYRVIEDTRVADQFAYSLAVVGQYFASIGEWMFSIRSLQNAIAIQPDYSDAYAHLGLARDQIGENGIVELLKAVDLAPDEVIPHLYLGMHWQLKNELDMAFNEFERAAQIDPTNPVVATQIGAVYATKGEINTAIQAYRAAAEMNPQDATFWILLAQVSLENEFQIEDVALPAARNAVALSPDNPAALDALGYCYYLLEDFNYAETFILQSIQINPSFALGQYHLGLLRNYQGESMSAIAAFTMAYQLDPEGNIGIRAQRALETISP
jgi:tetratricopeptide (TPR) repeat protein